mmetsp:Transcript_26338/g.77305  ORF Transcript_26338/g.77305 Transcript_26338/m.77305 type:complete len:355 (-) Transcript_26338:7058-8122(-)
MVEGSADARAVLLATGNMRSARARGFLSHRTPRIRRRNAAGVWRQRVVAVRAEARLARGHGYCGGSHESSVAMRRGARGHLRRRRHTVTIGSGLAQRSVMGILSRQHGVAAVVPTPGRDQGHWDCGWHQGCPLRRARGAGRVVGPGRGEGILESSRRGTQRGTAVRVAVLRGSGCADGWRHCDGDSVGRRSTQILRGRRLQDGGASERQVRRRSASLLAKPAVGLALHGRGLDVARPPAAPAEHLAHVHAGPPGPGALRGRVASVRVLGEGPPPLPLWRGQGLGALDELLGRAHVEEEDHVGDAHAGDARDGQHGHQHQHHGERVHDEEVGESEEAHRVVAETLPPPPLGPVRR